MNAPIYTNSEPYGCCGQGVVAYTQSNGDTSMLPPSYAGKAWDDFTFWDTKNEKKIKQEEAAAAELAYQERLANISGNQGEVKQVGTGVYVVMGLVTLGIGYALLKSK